VTRNDPEWSRWSPNCAAASGRPPRNCSSGRPAAITLALLLTDEELDSLEKRAGDGEIAERGRPGGSNVARPQPAARHGEPAQVFAQGSASLFLMVAELRAQER
jgi:hypothetical protein